MMAMATYDVRLVIFSVVMEGLVKQVYSWQLLILGAAIALFILAVARLAILGDRFVRVEAASAEALRQSKERFRSLVQNSSDIIAILDANGNIDYISSSSERILGYKAEKLLSQNAFDYIHPEDVANVRAAFASALQNPIINVTVEYRVRHANGNWIYLESVGHNLLDDATIKGVVANSRNITKRKQTEDSLRQVEQKYRSIFENAVEGIFQTTAEGKYLTVNPMLARIYGYESPAELISSITDIKHQLYVDPNRRAEFTRILQKEDVIWGFESEVYRKDGEIIWISESARALRDVNNNLLGYEGTVVDITQRKQAEAELHKRDRLLEGIAAAMTHLLTSSDYSTAMNQALETLGRITGVDRIYIYEQHSNLENNETQIDISFEWTRFSRNERGCGENPARDLTKNKSSEVNKEECSCFRLSAFSCLQCPLPDRKSPISELILPIFVDRKSWGYISFENYYKERHWSSGEESILTALAASIGGALKRQKAEATIRYQAFHDLLTGLPNRTFLNEKLSLALAMANKRRDKMAVMFLDLDRFKTINDTLGHAVGDRLLQGATQRLKCCLRSDDIIARWGGDEFTLLLPQISGLEDATKIAQRIIDVLKPAFNLEGYQLYVTSSIGIAIYPEHGEDAQTLLRNADAALYRAKGEGRNNYQIYVPAMNSQASELLELESRLHQGLEEEEFVLYYQPQVNLNTGEITRMEALLRWKHPDKGLILPKTFIRLAEENGLIIPLGTWVLRSACSQNKAWQDAGLPALRVAVNLSPLQLQQPGFVDVVAQILEETGLSPEFLELEITETAVMQNADFTKAALERFVNMGCRITLDDFGTGYSSLSYLKSFPLHALKIDKSFVRDLACDPSDAAIVSTIIALGRGLNLSVVAEGVETLEQVEYLRNLQCQEMQGYIFSKPLSAEDATKLLSVKSQRSLVISH